LLLDALSGCGNGDRTHGWAQHAAPQVSQEEFEEEDVLDTLVPETGFVQLDPILIEIQAIMAANHARLRGLLDVRFSLTGDSVTV
jgi:hypothetical protein